MFRNSLCDSRSSKQVSSPSSWFPLEQKKRVLGKKVTRWNNNDNKKEHKRRTYLEPLAVVFPGLMGMNSHRAHNSYWTFRKLVVQDLQRNRVGNLEAFVISSSSPTERQTEQHSPTSVLIWLRGFKSQPKHLKRKSESMLGPTFFSNYLSRAQKIRDILERNQWQSPTNSAHLRCLFLKIEYKRTDWY